MLGQNHFSYKKKVLVTGASGFIGRHLIDVYAKNGWEVVAVVRSLATCSLDRYAVSEIVEVPDIGGLLDWMPFVQGCTVVAHLAARAHKVHENQYEGSVAFNRVNVSATARLARAASNAGVQRFVFVSSSGVMGSKSKRPWTEDDIPNPQSAYAESKLLAEGEVKAIAYQSKMDYVILRPALVYGEGSPGNLARLIRIVATGLPLPFNNFASKRSMVNVKYLSKIIVDASTLGNAANQTYLVADGRDLTLPEIIRAFAVGLNVPVRLFKCPFFALKLISKLIGKSSDLQKLTAAYQINSTKLQCDFDVEPFVSTEESLATVARGFVKETQRA
jgi:nucleoside-diphosphate-sugar epimerase